ncbi:unnamed protein product, partial [Mesorhabditis belari]|uniref:Cytosolic fatty-acid binding proteins domain-containing protein n=1 Tax=Mesorhabditis belari TaxID=2138241 RepID=A0AAF3J917_9BILA
MRSLAVLSVVALVGLSAATKNLPEKFYGKFLCEDAKNENFDEYLTAKGYSWFTRKLIVFAKFEKVFARSTKPGHFSFENLTSKKDVSYKDVEIGKQFVGEGLDSTKHEITFTLEGDHVFEKHHPLEAGEAKDETYEYYMEGDYLVNKMEAGSIIAKRYYKRTE